MTFAELELNQAFKTLGGTTLFYKKDFGDGNNCLWLDRGEIFVMSLDIEVIPITLQAKEENTFLSIDYGRLFVFDNNPSVVCQKISMNGRPGFVVGTRYYDHDQNDKVTLTY